jgi:hypothetical protein
VETSQNPRTSSNEKIASTRGGLTRWENRQRWKRRGPRMKGRKAMVDGEEIKSAREWDESIVRN